MDDKEKTLEEILPTITDPRKQAFIKLLPSYHYLGDTAKAIGVHRTTIWHWLTKDSVFATAYYLAKKVDDDHWLTLHLKNIREITLDKDVPPQTRLLGSFFEVKKLDPSYRDNPPEYLTQVGHMTIHLDIPRREYLPSITVEAKELPEGRDDVTKQEEG